MNLKGFFFILFLGICQSGYSQSTRIKSFDQLIETLHSGARVRAVIHYSQCSRTKEQEIKTPLPEAITGMEIDTYEFFAPGAAHNKIAFIVFSTSKLIQNPLGKGFVYNYGKVRINADNTCQVTAKYIHPRRYKVLMDELFTAKLNDGVNGEGINLYK